MAKFGGLRKADIQAATHDMLTEISARLAAELARRKVPEKPPKTPQQKNRFKDL